MLTGCGTQDALVGLHPAPAEQTAAAPLDTEGATAVAARLLAAKDATVEGDAKAAAAARAEVLTGDALRVANAEAARAISQAETTELAAEPDADDRRPVAGPPVAARHPGLDARRGHQHASGCTSCSPTSPTQPFRIASSVPMFGGAELPALGEQLAGAPLLDTAQKNGLAVSPADAVKAYAAAIAQPKGKATDVVTVDDPFATGLKTAAAAQTKALGKLGTPDADPRAAARRRRHLPARRRRGGDLRPDEAHRHGLGEEERPRSWCCRRSTPSWSGRRR